MLFNAGTVTAAAKPHDRACHGLPNFAATADAEIVIFGDAHGTVEAPATFMDAACLFSNHLHGKKAVVALELPDSFNAEFAWVGKKPVGEINRRIEANEFWDHFKDGRHSFAMLTMVQRLVQLSDSSDGHLKLVALERPQIDSAGAEFLLDQMRKFGTRKALILIGNAHARLIKAQQQPSMPFAQNIKNAGFSVISLDIWSGGGDGWFCTPQCGQGMWHPRAHFEDTRIVLEPCLDQCVYNGFYFVPHLTLSKPVRQD